MVTIESGRPGARRSLRAVALIFLMTGSTGGFWSGHLIFAPILRIPPDLKVGAPVNLEGVTIGNVSGIHIVPSHRAHAG